MLPQTQTQTEMMRLNMALGQLAPNEVVDTTLLRMMGSIPRERFVPEVFRHCAYVDKDIEIAPGRYLMAPMLFARLVKLAGIAPSERVLVTGTGTGYSAAVLAPLGGHVVALESDAALFEKAKANLEALRVRDVDLQKVRSLTEGFAMSSPFDVIVVEGAVDYVPRQLSGQLSKHGRLVTVRNIGSRAGVHSGLGRGVLVRRDGDHIDAREYFDASAPLLPGFEEPQRFVLY